MTEVQLDFREDVEGMERLNPRQVRWIMAYLEHDSVSKANAAAGFSGGGLLKVPAVIGLVAEERRRQLKKLEVTQERVVAELACGAFYDIADFLNEDGSMKPINEVPEAARRALSGLDIIEREGGESGESKRTFKLRTVDKNRSLELLGKWLKMWTDKIEVEGMSGLAERLAAARRNAGLPQEETP